MGVSEWRVGDVLLCLNNDSSVPDNENGYRAGEYVCIRELAGHMKCVATTNVRGGRNGWNVVNFEWIGRGNFDDYVRISTL